MSMQRISLVGLLAATYLACLVCVPSFADDAATTTCKDGTTSTAAGRGACSGHGGVQKPAATSAGPAPATPAPPASTPAAAPATGGAATCKDGTTSSATGRGACSGHGGVQKATKATPASAAAQATSAPATTSAASPGAGSPSAAAAKSTAMPTKSAPTTTASNTDPTGATAKCKDGTYSKSTHRSGTCSHHGGVDTWLSAAQ